MESQGHLAGYTTGGGRVAPQNSTVEAINFPYGVSGTAVGGDDDETKLEYQFLIPLSHICSAFDYPDKLLPQRMLSGAVLELFLESPATSLHMLTGPEPSYTISNCKLYLDCHKLVDVAASELEKISATNSLEVSTRAVFSTSQATSATHNTFNINKAVSRGLRAFAVKKNVTDMNNVMLDSMASDDCLDAEKFQWRCGAMYYPQAPVQGPVETVYNLLYSLDDPDAYSLDIKGPMKDDLVVPAVNLESSTILNMSGQSLNNSRILSIDWFTGDPSGQSDPPIPSRTVFFFLEYQSVFRVFLHNIVRLE